MNAKLKDWIKYCNKCYYQRESALIHCELCEYGFPPTEFCDGICQGCETKLIAKPFNFDGTKICENCFDLLNATML